MIRRLLTMKTKRSNERLPLIFMVNNRRMGIIEGEKSPVVDVLNNRRMGI